MTRRIIHAEIWATKTIPADLPPMIEFKRKADKLIKDRYGITVEHVSADVTYEDVFYRITKPHGKSINSGRINGFPMIRSAWCNSKLKVKALNKIDKNAVSYIGIAYDEPKRFKVFSDKKISPLVRQELFLLPKFQHELFCQAASLILQSHPDKPDCLFRS